MRQRSFGVTALSFSSVMVALYSQFAAIALLLTASVFTAAGSTPAAFVLLLGAVFLGLTIAAYAVGYGFWARKQWSWTAGMALLVVFAVANVVLSAISANFISSILPAFAAIAAVWYLQRPAIKAELTGDAAPAALSLTVDALEGVEPAH